MCACMRACVRTCVRACVRVMVVMYANMCGLPTLQTSTNAPVVVTIARMCA